MEIHNISEDLIVNSVGTIFEAIKNENNPDGFCLCEQCKLDTICYALNRTEPLYIVSNRGMTRIEHDWLGKQQTEADLYSLIYTGLRVINHNKRSTANHDENVSDVSDHPAFYFPIIIGRLFDGENFAPIADAKVELYHGSKIVPMRNQNWQNPYTIILKTSGTYTFWPASFPAETIDIKKIFELTVKIETQAYEPLNHFFKISSISNIQTQNTHTSEKTFKLPDLYLFRPGEAEKNG